VVPWVSPPIAGKAAGVYRPITTGSEGDVDAGTPQFGKQVLRVERDPPAIGRVNDQDFPLQHNRKSFLFGGFSDNDHL
jgi:hypothetical protein